MRDGTQTVSDGPVARMRAAVIIRDGGCMAPKLDPRGAGSCYDAWGDLLQHQMDVEIDYIEYGALAPRHVLAIDHVSLCAGHHRGTGPQGGRIWAKQSDIDLGDGRIGSRREQLRRFLDSI